jgi:hypothetical protein
MTLSDSPAPLDASPLPLGVAEHVRSVVAYVMNHSGPRTRRFQERRQSKRQAFPYLVELVPIDDRNRPCGDSLLVLGKHLSDQGLDFHHQGPLPHRRFRASLETGDVQPVQLVLEVRWCRFIKRGWYESGGRFLRVVSSAETSSQLHN